MIGHTSFGYDAGFNDGYKKGRADARAEILKMVDWRADQDIVRRKIDIHIDFAEILTTENVLRIIEEQLKQLEVNR